MTDVLALPEMTLPTIDERVTAGADWLTTKNPGWLTLVNVNTLNMRSATADILGQLWGTFWAATAEPDGMIPSYKASGYGFTAYGYDQVPDVAPEDDEFDVLCHAWTAEIIRRRACLDGPGYRVQRDECGMSRYRCAVPVPLLPLRQWKVWNGTEWRCGQPLDGTAECGYHYDGRDPDLVALVKP